MKTELYGILVTGVGMIHVNIIIFAVRAVPRPVDYLNSLKLAGKKVKCNYLGTMLRFNKKAL